MLDKFCKNLRDLRIDNDLSQKKMAEILNVSQQAYSYYETGAREVPIEALIKLARYFNTTTDFLLGLTDEKERK